MRNYTSGPVNVNQQNARMIVSYMNIALNAIFRLSWQMRIFCIFHTKLGLLLARDVVVVLGLMVNAYYQKYDL